MINYPNGHPYHDQNQKKKQGLAQVKKQKTDFGKRGMNFEEEINESNRYYLSRDIAVIHKKPTPVQIVKVDYPRRSAATITEAYFRQASTTDYNGVYKGYYLDFEAKETRNKTSFPLNNFHQHQIDHMSQCENHGGLVFVLIYFSTLQRCFLIPFTQLYEYWSNQKKTGVKSIPLKKIESTAYEITSGIAPRIPYLTIVDTLIEQKEQSYDK